MAENPTPQEIVETARSGNTGAVKTLSDIRFEKLEARLAELEKVNQELRAANAELYSYAAQVSSQTGPSASNIQTSPSPAVQPAPAQPFAAQIVKDDTAEIAAKQREEANLNAVLQEMGYRKASQSQPDTTPKDGM